MSHSGVLEAPESQLKASVSMGGGKQRARGLRLVATDADFARGEGPDVRGTGIALLLAVRARRVNEDELSGAGSASLRVAATG